MTLWRYTPLPALAPARLNSIRALHRPATPVDDTTQPVPLPAPTLSQWAESALGFRPLQVQVDILDSTDPYVILCCSRQFGKTTFVALKLAWHAITHPGTNLVVGSPGEQQSQRLVDAAVGFLRHAGIAVRGASTATRGARLANGSAMHALPMNPKTMRGFSNVSLLIFEEAAYVPDHFYHMATAYQAAVANPSLWLLSTPGGQTGFFYEEWSDETRTHWRRHLVPASKCPHIRPEFLAMERIRKGDLFYRQEYECEFVASGGQIISRELWDAAIDPDDVPFNGGKPLWHD